MLATTFGYVAAVTGTFLMLPQVIKSWRTKRVEDLAIGTVILYFVNCLLWLIYGILITATPVIVANGIGLLVSIFQVAIKVRYGKQGGLSAN
ncbi:MAG: MtN3 and saliva related transmembrane protein [Parcubacteria group bacterium Gr01-1014_20]|nr:MAG: MtN3 and saliva related transmembrane protein [Parcubacteria group bacterium Gr01-1014_20]